VDDALLFLFDVPNDASVFARSRKRPREPETDGRDEAPGRGKVALWGVDV
jgi:hypothetical protein